MKKNKEYPIFFSFTKPKNFSGQTAASELIIEAMRAKGKTCYTIPLYHTSPGKNSFISYYLRQIYNQLKIIPVLLRLAVSRDALLHLNLGQSYWSFIRVGSWYIPIRLVNRSIKVVTSLHGNIFMSWDKKARITKSFMAFLNSSSIVTVLGVNQKSKLIQFGLDPGKIRIVPNSCKLDPVADIIINEKHSDFKDQINLLYLSLLIESKGYPLYLEALKILAHRNIEKKINAILCGPITFNPSGTEFRNALEKKQWIEKEIELINSVSDGNLTVEWIHGANGELKQHLFEKSHIFILPTSFPVETQPIVLLEALASGCSIITTPVGEIPTTLNNGCAVFLETIDPQILADSIYSLILNPDLRKKMAIEGVKLIRGHLNLDVHIDTWGKIFNEIMN